MLVLTWKNQGKRMYKIVINGDNRLDIEIAGKFDSDEMKAALDEMVSKSENIENGKMLYRLSDFDFPTLGAIGVELSRLPELFKIMKKFDRAAVLSDKKWIQKIGEIEGALIPGLEIKSFDMDEVEKAEAWLES